MIIICIKCFNTFVKLLCALSRYYVYISEIKCCSLPFFCFEECTFELNKDKKEFKTHENVNKGSNQLKQYI